MALTDSLSFYYKCDENAASTTVADATSTNAATSSTNTSNLYDASGKINSCFTFNGSSESCVTNGNVGITGDAARTINAWIYPVSNTSNPYLIAWGASQYYDFFGMRLTDSGNLIAWIYGAEFTIGAVSNSAWSMITLTHDGTTVRGYINGTEGNTEAFTLTTKDTALVFGSYWNQSSNYFDGKMDEIGVWSRALSQAEITSLYNSGSGLAYPFGSEAAPLKIFDVRFG